MKANYHYPLDLDWTTAEKIKVTTFYALVEMLMSMGLIGITYLLPIRVSSRSYRIKEPSVNWGVNLKHSLVTRCTRSYKWHAKV